MNRRKILGLGLVTLALLGLAWATLGFTIYMPFVPNQPSPTPTNTHTPTVTPSPTPTFVPVHANCNGGQAFGIRCDYFWLTNNTINPGGELQFKFKGTNLNTSPIRVSGLGALWTINNARAGVQASWGPEADFPAVSEWEDNLRINTTGTYQVYLAICVKNPPDSGRCTGDINAWQIISGPATLVVR